MDPDWVGGIVFKKGILEKPRLTRRMGCAVEGSSRAAGQPHCASARSGMISCLTVLPKQLAGGGGAADGGVAAPRAVNLLIAFGIQLSAGLMSREETRAAPDECG